MSSQAVKMMTVHTAVLSGEDSLYCLLNSLLPGGLFYVNK